MCGWGDPGQLELGYLPYYKTYIVVFLMESVFMVHLPT